jgi:hypothetical protein
MWRAKSESDTMSSSRLDTSTKLKQGAISFAAVEAGSFSGGILGIETDVAGLEGHTRLKTMFVGQ